MHLQAVFQASAWYLPSCVVSSFAGPLSIAFVCSVDYVVVSAYFQSIDSCFSQMTVCCIYFYYEIEFVRYSQKRRDFFLMSPGPEGPHRLC